MGGEYALFLHLAKLGAEILLERCFALFCLHMMSEYVGFRNTIRTFSGLSSSSSSSNSCEASKLAFLA